LSAFRENLQILSVSPFEKSPINEALSLEKPINGEWQFHNSLSHKDLQPDSTEFYYVMQLRKGIVDTLDFQEVGNSAYNSDRGPGAIIGLRVHFEH
jgi:hypothetical protein